MQGLGCPKVKLGLPLSPRYLLYVFDPGRASRLAQRIVEARPRPALPETLRVLGAVAHAAAGDLVEHGVGTDLHEFRLPLRLHPRLSGGVGDRAGAQPLLAIVRAMDLVQHELLGSRPAVESSSEAADRD